VKKIKLVVSKRECCSGQFVDITRSTRESSSVLAGHAQLYRARGIPLIPYDYRARDLDSSSGMSLGQCQRRQCMYLLVPPLNCLRTTFDSPLNARDLRPLRIASPADWLR
jgi:hypothetical protein